jgi:hemerythrin-like domain-containing protein
MTSTREPFDAATALAGGQDGFDALDLTHRQIVVELGKLAALVSRLDSAGLDTETRNLAREVCGFFATTARLHHEDEERHVFPQMEASGDADIVQAVLRLKQDHHWIEEDWRELAPHVDAVASGQLWYDVDVLREGVNIFIALSLDHMALEESYVYPEAKAKLGAVERREMGREMAARRRQKPKRKARPAAPPG